MGKLQWTIQLANKGLSIVKCPLSFDLWMI